MKRKAAFSCALKGCGMILISLLTGVVCLAIYVWPQPRKTQVSLYDLLVEPEAFPSGWTLERDLEWISLPEKAIVDDFRAAEGVIRLWVPPGCPNPPVYSQPPFCRSAWHMILRYRNSIQAAEAFYRDLPGAFRGISKWEVPEGWNYQSPVADRFRFACTKECPWGGGCPPSGRYIYCSAIGQYDEFISVLDIPMVGNIALNEVEVILRAIDARADQVLVP